MRDNLFPTTVYVDSATKKEIRLMAYVTQQKEADVYRTALKEGLQTMRSTYAKATKALVALSGTVPKGSGVPADLAERHNAYAWE